MGTRGIVTTFEGILAMHRAAGGKGVDVLPLVGDPIARKDVYVDSIGFLRALGFTLLE